MIYTEVEDGGELYNFISSDFSLDACIVLYDYFVFKKVDINVVDIVDEYMEYKWWVCWYLKENWLMDEYIEKYRDKYNNLDDSDTHILNSEHFTLFVMDDLKDIFVWKTEDSLILRQD